MSILTCDVKRIKMQSGVQFIRKSISFIAYPLKQIKWHCADFQLHTTTFYNNTINPQHHFVLPRYDMFLEGNRDTL